MLGSMAQESFTNQPCIISTRGGTINGLARMLMVTGMKGTAVGQPVTLDGPDIQCSANVCSHLAFCWCMACAYEGAVMNEAEARPVSNVGHMQHPMHFWHTQFLFTDPLHVHREGWSSLRRTQAKARVQHLGGLQGRLQQQPRLPCARPHRLAQSQSDHAWMKR